MRADADDKLAYNTTKAMVESLDNYKDGAPGAAGWAMANQAFEWAVPYHDGAIDYFKEIGVWTDAMQAHNDALVDRQGVLKTAWEAYKVVAPSDDDAFKTGWMAARAVALTAAGMPVVF